MTEQLAQCAKGNSPKDLKPLPTGLIHSLCPLVLSLPSGQQLLFKWVMSTQCPHTSQHKRNLLLWQWLPQSGEPTCIGTTVSKQQRNHHGDSGHLCFSYQPNTEQNRVYAGRIHNYTMCITSPLPQRDVTYTTLVSFQFPTVKEPTLTTLMTSLHCSDS